MEKTDSDQHFMALAIDQAKIAEENGDVPIGAVIVSENQIIGKAYNQREQFKDPTVHAEDNRPNSSGGGIRDLATARLHNLCYARTMPDVRRCASSGTTG